MRLDAVESSTANIVLVTTTYIFIINWNTFYSSRARFETPTDNLHELVCNIVLVINMF